MRPTLKNTTNVEETKQIILTTPESIKNLANLFDRLLLEEKPNLLDQMEQLWDEAGRKQGYRSKEDLKRHWRERKRLDGFRYNVLPHQWNGTDVLRLVAKFEGRPRSGEKGYKEWQERLGSQTWEKCGQILPARLENFYSNGAVIELSPVCKKCQNEG